MKRLLLALLLAGPVHGQDEARARVEALLVKLDQDGDVERTALDLAALGPRAAEALLSSLARADGPRALSLAGALASSDPRAVARAAAARLDSMPDLADRRAILTALGAVGGEGELALCARAATLEHGALEGEFQRALGAMLARGVEPYGELGVEWPGLAPELRSAAARALGDAGGDGALRFLGGLLAHPDDTAGLILAQLGRAAGGAGRDAALEVSEEVRPLLQAGDQGLQKSVAIVLGRLEDAGSVPTLVELLRSDSPAVRANAHWALQRITTLAFPASPDPWDLWLRRESSWWMRRAPQAFSDLGAREEAVAAAAVKDVGEHRLDRHTLARELARALAHPSPDVRRLACESLGRLGADECVSDLVALLEDRSAEVRASARATLRGLTGSDLGADPLAWGGLVAAAAPDRR